jgi:hypothetical protein
MDFSQEELFDTIDRFIDGLLERAGVVQPPVDALDIAENHLGIPIEVVEPVEEDERGRRRPRSRPRGAGIVLTPDMSEEQRQKVAADGIARATMAEILRKLHATAESENQQLLKHIRGLVVPRLLIPKKLLRNALKECRYDVLALKEAFATAATEAIALRLLDLDDACAISIVDDGIVSLRKSNRFAVSKKLEPAEQTCIDLIMKLDRPQRIREAEWTVHGWPVPARSFRRIILRSVPDDV